MSSDVRLPHQPPPWLTPERIATWAAVITSVQVMLQVTAGGSGGSRLEAALIVALPVAIAARLATRRGTTTADVLAGALRWVPLCGAACAVSVALLHGLADNGARGVTEALTSTFWIAIFGMFASLPLLMAGLPLVLVASAGRARPSHEAPVRALVGAGMWMLAAAGFLFAIRSHASGWSFAPGALTVALGAVWLARRARFVRRVHAGKEPAFVVVDVGPQAFADGLIPYRPSRCICCDVQILAAVASPVAGAYRAFERPIPLCLLSRPG